MGYSRKQKMQTINGHSSMADSDDETFFVSLEEASRLIDWDVMSDVEERYLTHRQV